MIRFAAATFAVQPRVGAERNPNFGAPIARVFDPIKTSVFLLQTDAQTIVLHTSNFTTDKHSVSAILREAMAQALGISSAQVFCFSSHNHSVALLGAKTYDFLTTQDPADLCPADELTWEGQEVLRLSIEAVTRLRSQLQPVTVHVGKGSERRFTHNRKGRRADGSTYLMREEDRLLLGVDFTGDIDDDAFVVGFFKHDGKPAGFLTQFTGHPVTAHHPDRPIVCAEFPQVACDDLSAAYGNVPVGFLQGFAGDTNAKGLLADMTPEERVRRSAEYGHQLGETFCTIAKALTPSAQQDLHWRRQPVTVPFREVPSVWELETRLQGVTAFLNRCAQNDDAGTRRCDGLNFPRNMTVATRAALIQPTRQWLEWALSLHRENRLHEALPGLVLDIAAIRIGDVGIVGVPCEPFLEVGRQLKQHAPTKVTLPCGYMQHNAGYVPDSANCADLDYPSSYYRYTKRHLPFRQPAGNLLAAAGAQMLKETYA